MSRSILRWVVQDHLFVFFCCSPCSGTVRYCWRDNSVEQVLVGVVGVVVDKIGMSVPVDVWRKADPAHRDSVLHLCGFLVHASDVIIAVPDIFHFSYKRKYLYVHPVDFNFSCSVSFLVC